MGRERRRKENKSITFSGRKKEGKKKKEREKKKRRRKRRKGPIRGLQTGRTSIHRESRKTSFPTSPEEGEGRYIHSSWGGRALAAPGGEARGPEEFESLIFCLKTPEGEFLSAGLGSFQLGDVLVAFGVVFFPLSPLSVPPLIYSFSYVFSARSFWNIFFFAGSNVLKKKKIKNPTKRKKKKTRRREGVGR